MERPWSDEQARWIVRSAASLGLAGAEPVGPIVLPNAHFFPDRFDKTPASVGKLFDRLRQHVGLSDTEAEVLLVDPEEGRVVSSCSSGGCGSSGVKTLAGHRVSERSDGSYAVVVATSEVTHPTVLTTVLCRAVGQIFLREVDMLTRFAKSERDAAGDVAAILLGLGVLVANGSAIEVKGCGGVKIHSATSLGAPEAVLALGLVLEREALRKKPVEGIDKALDPVPRSFLGFVREFVAENRDVVRRFEHAPEPLARGEFSLREPGSSLGSKLRRVFGFGKGRDEDPIEALEREAALAPASSPGSKKLPSKKSARLDEIRALVDESFE